MLNAVDRHVRSLGYYFWVVHDQVHLVLLDLVVLVRLFSQKPGNP